MFRCRIGHDLIGDVVGDVGIVKAFNAEVRLALHVFSKIAACCVYVLLCLRVSRALITSRYLAQMACCKRPATIARECSWRICFSEFHKFNADAVNLKVLVLIMVCMHS